MEPTAYKRLDDLSFQDLYIDIDEENYPNIRQALGNISQKLRFIIKRRQAEDQTHKDTNFLNIILQKNSLDNQTLRRRHS